MHAGFRHETHRAIGLKYADGFTRLLPSIGTAAAMIVSLGFLGLALKTLPDGTAALGVILFGDRRPSRASSALGSSSPEARG